MQVSGTPGEGVLSNEACGGQQKSDSRGLGNGRLSELCIDATDRPGFLARVAGLIGKARANIVEVYHQRVLSGLRVKAAEFYVLIEMRDSAHLNRVADEFKAAGHAVQVKGAVIGR